MVEVVCVVETVVDAVLYVVEVVCVVEIVVDSVLFSFRNQNVIIIRILFK